MDDFKSLVMGDLTGMVFLLSGGAFRAKEYVEKAQAKRKSGMR